MRQIRRTYGVPAKRGGRISFTNAAKAAQGTIVGSRGHYLRVRFDESGVTHSMDPAWMVVYLEPTKTFDTDHCCRTIKTLRKNPARR